jgi:multidrug efflux pump subunit AcrA (membrane-fusion protein)
MLLKLLMPPYFRVIEGGTIVKWHKSEGEFVEFGDDLFDVRVERVRITKTIKEATAGEWLQRLSTEMKKHNAGAALQGAPQAPLVEAGQACDELEFKTWDAVAYLRISSSDMGYLRRIHVLENDYRHVGDLMAELSTAADEPLDDATANVATFRVVPNLI